MEKGQNREQDVVNVYSLQESSSDWVPASRQARNGELSVAEEWKFERVKPCALENDTILLFLTMYFNQLQSYCSGF